ncbi:hypothetical protein [Paraglaciecola sp.]|uniref:hypothetical protein n=1 Tax=Paraglaciecola sp. TaxID=1920173 RepID=UPI003EFA45B8
MSHYLTKYLGVLFVATCIVLQLCAFAEPDSQETYYVESKQEVDDTQIVDVIFFKGPPLKAPSLKTNLHKTTALRVTKLDLPLFKENTHSQSVNHSNSNNHPFIVFINTLPTVLLDTISVKVNLLLRQQILNLPLLVSPIKYRLIHNQNQDERPLNTQL